MHLDIAPYSTSGGGVLDLRVSPQAIDTMQLKLGDKLTYETNAGGWTLKPQVHAYYVRNLNVQRYQTSASFLAGGSSFTSTSPARDADLANVGAGLTVLRNGALSFDAGYDFTTGASTKDHKFFLQAKAEF